MNTNGQLCLLAGCEILEPTIHGSEDQRLSRLVQHQCFERSLSHRFRGKKDQDGIITLHAEFLAGESDLKYIVEQVIIVSMYTNSELDG